jgi:flavodoxin I
LVKNEIDVTEPIDIDTVDAGSLSAVFREHDALIVGTPTWNTNADTFRSGTGWDDIYYDKLPETASVLSGKKVAVFGLGDQVSYGENYADATGELYSVFENVGCTMVPYAQTSQHGYDHIASKSILLDTNKFCGLLLDQINQEDKTDDRVASWIEQLKMGGFFETSETTDGFLTSTVDDEDDEVTIADGNIQNELGQAAMDQSHVSVTGSSSISSFTPHINPVTGNTMWTSPDGRKSYFTLGERKGSFVP